MLPHKTVQERRIRFRRSPSSAAVRQRRRAACPGHRFRATARTCARRHDQRDERQPAVQRRQRQQIQRREQQRHERQRVQAEHRVVVHRDVAPPGEHQPQERQRDRDQHERELVGRVLQRVERELRVLHLLPKRFVQRCVPVSTSTCIRTRAVAPPNAAAAGSSSPPPRRLAPARPTAAPNHVGASSTPLRRPAARRPTRRRP